VPAPYPRALRGRIAALNRLPQHDARDPIVRDVVRQRAADACEYCLMPTTGTFEIEHIIPKQRWNDYLTGTYPGLRRAKRLALSTPITSEISPGRASSATTPREAGRARGPACASSTRGLTSGPSTSPSPRRRATA